MNKIMSKFNDIKKNFEEFSENVNWLLFLLVMIFAPISWLNVNGILTEIPNMIESLPEGWRVPSYVSLLTQIAQLIALIYLLLVWLFPSKVTHKRSIYVIMFFNLITCFALSYFWDKTLFFFGEKRSFGLYLLSLISALLTGASALSFIPYIAENFPKEYIFAYYIGESFSALIPAALSLIQGVSVSDECEIRTVMVKKYNEILQIDYFEVESQLLPIKQSLNYSVLIYFIAIFIIMCGSVFSFFLIDKLPYFKKFYRENMLYREEPTKYGVIAEKEPLNSVNRSESNCKKEKCCLFIMNFVITFFFFGFLPGIQSYSTLPYGNLIYSLSINLTFLALPFAVFVSMWSYKVSVLRLIIELSIAVTLTIYIITLSFFSPCPLLVSHWLGSVITVLFWFIAGFIFIRVRCIIATKLEEYGGKNIFMKLGLVSLFGQFMGGLSVFLLVDTFRLLKEKPQCVFDFSYCE